VWFVGGGGGGSAGLGQAELGSQEADDDGDPGGGDGSGDRPLSTPPLRHLHPVSEAASPSWDLQHQFQLAGRVAPAC